MGGNGSATAAATMAAAAADKGGGGWPPFTMAQWQELDHQAMIFKYIKEGIPMPPELVAPIQRSLESAPDRFIHYPSLRYYSFYGKKIDPEPGRCRRPDGKKWRCSKDAHPDSKYCERHMNRGHYHSRKHVEAKADSQSMSTTKSDMTTGSCSRGISFQYLPQSTPESSFTIGFVSALSSSQVESTSRNLSKYSEMKQDATVGCLDNNSVIGSTYYLSRAAGKLFLGKQLSTADILRRRSYRNWIIRPVICPSRILFLAWSSAVPSPQSNLLKISFTKNFFRDNQSCDGGSFSSV